MVKLILPISLVRSLTLCAKTYFVCLREANHIFCTYIQANSNITTSLKMRSTIIFLAALVGYATAAKCPRSDKTYVRKVYPSRGIAGDEVTLRGFWRTGPSIRAECIWWSRSSRSFYSTTSAAIDIATGDITCQVPPKHVDDKKGRVGVSVKVWDLLQVDQSPSDSCLRQSRPGKFQYESYECEEKTQPKIHRVDPPSAKAGDEIQIKGRWLKGYHMEASCLFWSDNLEKFYAVGIPGNMDSRGRISCIVPEKEDGAEDEVKVSVQVYDEKAMQPDLNSCFSHGGAPLSGGQTSVRKGRDKGKPKRGAYGDFRYEGNHCCDISPYHAWRGGRKKKCKWSCGKGTRPDKDSSCGECVCLRGMKETGTDAFQRRTCERVFECSKRTQPMIYKVLADSPVSEGDEIELKGRWRRGRNVEAKCLFYTADDVAVAVNQPATMDNRGTITCTVPTLPTRSPTSSPTLSPTFEPTNSPSEPPISPGGPAATSVPTTPPSFNENGDYDQDYNNGGLDYGGSDEDEYEYEYEYESGGLDYEDSDYDNNRRRALRNDDNDEDYDYDDDYEDEDDDYEDEDYDYDDEDYDYDGEDYDDDDEAPPTELKVVVLVYDKYSDVPNANACYSHGGSYPDKRGEFAIVEY